jgi:alkylation response protein AidB-like acyl-CoA dehydrogenase
MNTTLSAEQQTAKNQYDQFASEFVQPIARQLDERTANLKELLQKAGQQGYLGLTVPKEYGGSGSSLVNAVLFAEAIAEHEPGLALSYASHLAAVELIIRYGTANQKSRYLPLLARGESLGTLATAEATAGSDFAAVRSQVTRAGTNLNGKKVWVVNADISSLAVVSARNEQDQLGVYLVDMESAASLQISADHPKLGLRSASTNFVEFVDHGLHAEALLGGDGPALANEQIQFALDVAKVIIAAAAVGLSESSLRIARDHARTREQFGTSIGHFQAIQWKLADASCDIRASRFLTYRAACSKEENPKEFRRNAAMAKWLASKTARVQSGEALQVCGAIGLTTQSPLERFYRDAKVMEIAEETSELQKQLIANELGVSVG